MPAKQPTYSEMALNAVACLPSRANKGVSLVKIKEQITEMYKVDPINKNALSTALSKSVTGGELVKVKASYKLSDEQKAKMPSKAKILTAAKNIGSEPAAPKPAKKATTTKVSSFYTTLCTVLFSC